MNSSIQQIFRIHLRTLGLFSDTRVLRYVLLSAVINLVFAFLILYWLVKVVWDRYQTLLLQWSEQNSMMDYLWLIVQKLFPVVLTGLVVYILFKTVLLLINIPVFAKVSETVEKITTGKVSKLEGNLYQQFIRGLKMSVWAGLREIIASVACLLLHIIPGLGSLLFLVVMFLIQSYFAGVNYADFVLERHGYNSKDSIQYIRSHNTEMTVLGSAFALLILIPVVGVLIAPIFTVCSATLYVVEEQDKRSLR